MTERHHATDLSCEGAATALREAHRRVRGGLDAADACGWAIAMLPESRAAQRLMLDWLLMSGQANGAATLAHTLLHAHGDDWRLWLRLAEALLALDRIEEADQAIDRALAKRPHHRRTLLLKADIAARLDDHAASLAALESADAHHPLDGEIARRLIDALLDCDRVRDAAGVLAELADPEPELSAAVLTAEGRLLDARQRLEEAVFWELDETRCDHLSLALIDVLERSADWPALRTMQARDDLTPIVATRLAETCLAMGSFATAGRLLSQAGGTAESPRNPNVAAALAALRSGEQSGAPLQLSRASDAELKPADRALPWLRSLLGLVMAEQIDAQSVRRAGADPSINVLDALLPSAIVALDDALQSQPDSANADRWQMLRDDTDRALAKQDDLSAAIEHAQAIDFAIRRAA